MTTEELIATAAPLIRDVGPAFYFAPPTLDRGKAIGLDGFRFYFFGRGGVLGDVEAPVVHSAFGYFNPKLVRNMWDSARERSSLSARDTGRAYLECCHEFGRQHYAGIDGLEAFCEAAAAVDDAADDAGLTLYAGISAEPRPGDPPARAAHLVTVLRELRGSAHLLAVLASG
ncbi:MAG: SCO6745 family protein, partial [Acidimicrobiales bacterium]